MLEKEIQTVWRTMSELPNGSGYIIWDVREVIGGDVTDSYAGIKRTPNGKQIYVSVEHAFDLPRAVERLFEQDVSWEKVFVVHSKVNGLDWHGFVSK